MTTTTDTVLQHDGHHPATIDRAAVLRSGHDAIKVLSDVWSTIRRLPAGEVDACRSELAEQLVAAIDHVRAMEKAVFRVTSLPALDCEERLEAAREVIAARYPAPTEGGR